MARLIDLAAMAEDVYSDSTHGPSGWERHNSRAPLAGLTGFYGARYVQGRTLVIAFRGSEKPGDDFIRDWLINDIAIAARVIPVPQVTEAMGFAEDAILSARPAPTSIYITGHSLGGGLAQIVAGSIGSTIGVSFNAPGMADHVSSLFRARPNEDQVLNLRVAGDPVSKVGRHIGRPPIELANENCPTTVGTAVNVLTGIADGLFVGLRTGGHPVAMLALGAAGGGQALAGAAMELAKAHLMNAVLACLRNNPLALRDPATLLSTG